MVAATSWAAMVLAYTSAVAVADVRPGFPLDHGTAVPTNDGIHLGDPADLPFGTGPEKRAESGLPLGPGPQVPHLPAGVGHGPEVNNDKRAEAHGFPAGRIVWNGFHGPVTDKRGVEHDFPLGHGPVVDGFNAPVVDVATPFHGPHTAIAERANEFPSHNLRSTTATQDLAFPFTTPSWSGMNVGARAENVAEAHGSLVIPGWTDLPVGHGPPQATAIAVRANEFPSHNLRSTTATQLPGHKVTGLPLGHGPVQVTARDAEAAPKHGPASILTGDRHFTLGHGPVVFPTPTSAVYARDAEADAKHGPFSVLPPVSYDLPLGHGPVVVSSSAAVVAERDIPLGHGPVVVSATHDFPLGHGPVITQRDIPLGHGPVVVSKSVHGPGGIPTPPPVAARDANTLKFGPGPVVRPTTSHDFPLGPGPIVVQTTVPHFEAARAIESVLFDLGPAIVPTTFVTATYNRGGNANCHFGC